MPFYLIGSNVLANQSIYRCESTTTRNIRRLCILTQSVITICISMRWYSQSIENFSMDSSEWSSDSFFFFVSHVSLLLLSYPNERILMLPLIASIDAHCAITLSFFSSILSSALIFVINFDIIIAGLSTMMQQCNAMKSQMNSYYSKKSPEYDKWSRSIAMSLFRYLPLLLLLLFFHSLQNHLHKWQIEKILHWSKYSCRNRLICTCDKDWNMKRNIIFYFVVA